MNLIMGIFGGSIITALAGLIVRAFMKNSARIELFWSSLDDRIEDFMKRKLGFGLPQIVHSVNDEVAHRAVLWMTKYMFTRDNVAKFIRAVQKGDYSSLSLNFDSLAEELSGIEDIKDIKNASDKVREAFNQFNESQVVAVVQAEATKRGEDLPVEKAQVIVRANVVAAKPITNDAEVPATKEEIVNHLKLLAEKSQARQEQLKK